MGVCSEDVCVLLLTKGDLQVCLMLLAMSILALFIVTAKDRHWR